MPRPTDAAVILMAACVVVMTGAVVHREFYASTTRTAPGGLPMRHIDNWEAFANAGHVLGPASAPVKIVEFADYECPYCASASDRLHRMVGESHGRVAVMFRNYPLTRIHRYALKAAIAAECASDAGRFAAYHDALYRFQDSLGVWTWNQYARVAKISDIARFEDCVAHQRTLARIERDRAVGDTLRIEGTPTFIAGGMIFMGMVPDSVWHTLIGTGPSR